MSTTAPSPDRLRQIAILVTSVEGSVARQLLMHLPTEVARQVRSLASRLGPISEAEKRQILSDFQRTAQRPSTPNSTPNSTSISTPSAADRRATDSTAQYAPSHSPQPAPKLVPADVDSAVQQLDRPPAQHGSRTTTAPAPSPEEDNETPWGYLSHRALLRFIRGERPTVIAVVLSQLHPAASARLLAQLDEHLSCLVLQGLADLGDIDPEAKVDIDQYLSQRLGEQEAEHENSAENSRRITEILNYAPASLRELWQRNLGVSEGENSQPAVALNEREHTPAPTPAVDSGLDILLDEPTMPAPSLHQLYDDATITTSDSQLATSPDDGLSVEDYLLPFPGVNRNSPQHAEAISELTASLPERNRIIADFESILELPPDRLAFLLSNTPSQEVLLALAGAKPDFMQRFYRLLDRGDAAALAKHLSRIGAINLRDIDAAQYRIGQRAAELLNNLERTKSATPGPSPSKSANSNPAASAPANLAPVQSNRRAA